MFFYLWNKYLATGQHWTNLKEALLEPLKKTGHPKKVLWQCWKISEFSYFKFNFFGTISDKLTCIIRMTQNWPNEKKFSNIIRKWFIPFSRTIRYTKNQIQINLTLYRVPSKHLLSSPKYKGFSKFIKEKKLRRVFQFLYL